MTRSVVGLAGCLAAIGAGGPGSSHVPAAPPVDREMRVASAPDESMRTMRTERYRMSGRVRPLLFWIGKDDIGLGRIAWRSNGSDAGYELLVGTDPAKAPRGLNRWGYVAENAEGTGGTLLALMTGADDGSYEEAAQNAAKPAGAGDFRAIHASLRDGTATWQTARVATTMSLTVHDVDAAVSSVRAETDAAPRRNRVAAAGVRPGFLTSAAELIGEAVRASNGDGDFRPLLRRRVPYVFGQGAYELSLREIDRSRATVEGKETAVVRLAFEIRTLATDVRTRFEVTSGTEGRLAGVPVTISWQPRWWLRVGLALEP